MKYNVILVFSDFTLSDQLEKWLLVHMNQLGIFSLSCRTYVIGIYPAFPLDKLRIEFTSSVAKSNNPGISDKTFFACSVMPTFVPCH